MSAAQLIRRRFVDLGSHVIHYRKAGSGPCVVLVHQSPQSSAALIPLIQVLAQDFTVFAFDTPGCGESDPLPLKSPTIRDYASSLARTFEAVGLKRAGLFGSKTGACIALEFTRRFPAKVAGVVLDSLPVFTPAQVKSMTSIVRTDDGDDAYYLMPFQPKWDGSHLVSTWSHVRDHVYWFPWYERRARNRRDIDMPTPAALHDGVMDNFRAGDNLRTVVEAAFRYKSKSAAARLTVPAVFTAREEDMLYPCLRMLPPLRAGQRIVPLGRDMVAYREAIRKFLKPFAVGRSPKDPVFAPASGKTSRTFADLNDGTQVLFRVRNAGSRGRPLLMLHDGPGSGLGLMELAESLASERPVYVPDLPGNGDSDPLRGRKGGIPAYADSIVAALGRLGLHSVDLFGSGSGATVALAIAAARPRLVHRLMLHDLPVLTPMERRQLARHYTPPIEPTWDGGHLYKTWLMLRDQQIYWPWFDRRRQAIRPVDFVGAPLPLHQRLLEVLKARPWYGLTTQAAFRHKAALDLKRRTCPTLVLDRAGDVFAGRIRSAVRKAPGVSFVTVERDAGTFVRKIDNFLRADITMPNDPRLNSGNVRKPRSPRLLNEF